MSDGTKHDLGKLDYTLLEFDAIDDLVRVLMFGEKKYARENWKLVEPHRRYLSALYRHLNAYTRGEKIDQETGLPHLAHAMCNAMFLDYFDKREGTDEGTDKYTGVIPEVPK